MQYKTSDRTGCLVDLPHDISQLYEQRKTDWAASLINRETDLNVLRDTWGVLHMCPLNFAGKKKMLLSFEHMKWDILLDGL